MGKKLLKSDGEHASATATDGRRPLFHYRKMFGFELGNKKKAFFFYYDSKVENVEKFW